jgi:acetate---CoA ligase (ADP-forming)
MLNLERLFRPRSVAILGVSDKNPWGAIAARTLRGIGFEGAVYLVNRRGNPALGQETLMSCADADGEIDAAFVAVPAAHLVDALEDMACGGVKFGAVVTSGFAELGEEGAELQRQVFARAQELGITLLGPNSLGFTNFVDRIALGAMPMPTPVLPHPRVAVVSQSGATTVMIAQAAHSYNVPLSHMVALGNEAMIDIADVVHFLLQDEATRAICLFVESIRNPDTFREAAAAAVAARKPLVLLKVGTGELTAAVAQAHTGALVGDDKVFQAMCEAYNIVRVNSLEDLVVTADMLAAVGPIDADKGCACISVSGGACEIVADRGEEEGIPFPQFSPETLDRLAGILADFGAAHNPLDLTGAAMARHNLYSDSMKILAKDGQFGFFAVLLEVPMTEEQESPATRAYHQHVSSAFRELGVHGAALQHTLKSFTPYGRAYVEEFGHPIVSGGLDHSIRAIGHLYAWSRGLGRTLPQPQVRRATTDRPSGELATLAWLGERGVPVIPQWVATSRKEAIAFASGLDAPAVLKILSPDIAHKTEVGGVALNLSGAEAVGAAYDAILARVSAAKPNARIEGVLVSPMRSGGQELIVGIARDPQWGLVLALGMGGVWVELLKDTRLRLLPVSEEQVVAALRQLKAAALLTGFRGSRSVNLDKVAAAVTAVCNAALELGDDLEALEINPLRVEGDQVEALDALAVWTAG